MCPVDKPSPVAVLLILFTIPYFSRQDFQDLFTGYLCLSFLAMLVGHMPMIYCSRSAGVGAWRGAGWPQVLGTSKIKRHPPLPPHSQSRQKLAAYVPSCCEDENDTRESLGISTIWNVTHSADSRTHADTGEYDQLLPARVRGAAPRSRVLRLSEKFFFYCSCGR